LSVRTKSLPGDHVELAAPMVVLGEVLTKAGHVAEAEDLLRKGVAIREKKQPANHWQIASARVALGACLARQKKFADAEPLLLDGYKGLAQSPAAPPRRVAQALESVIELYERRGQTEQAELWRKKRSSP